MDNRWPEYPALQKEHVEGARLFAERKEMAATLSGARNGKIAEIGVWRGAFSRYLLEELAPRQFYAFDVFDGHTVTDWNGQTGVELFDGMHHRAFYEREIAPWKNAVTLVEGSSLETLKDYTDQSFDMVYIDGNHAYDFVRSDANFAARMIKHDGVLIFNDYMLIDHNIAFYGIVPVVNHMIVNEGWHLIGYSLNHGLYCDVALQRADVARKRRSFIRRLFRGFAP